LQILKNMRTKRHKNEEIWNSLNLTWTKYLIKFHHFEKSSNYHPNNKIYLKEFKFSQKITLHQNIPLSKHTLIIL
jgi:transposase